MILSTTDDLENYKINHYLGIVVGIAISRFTTSPLTMKESFSTSAYSEKYQEALQNTLEEAKEKVLIDLRAKAKAMSADAVIGIQIDHEITTSGGSTWGVLCTATGTAVKIA